MKNEDIRFFAYIAQLTQAQLKKYLIKHLKEAGYTLPISFKSRKFVYAPGDVPILLVAHMDTVHKVAPQQILLRKQNELYSPQGIGGDDRCGIYIILQLLKNHKCHVLFTEDEETGMHGARDFLDYCEKNEVKPEVKYMIEFDRRGRDDACFYDCDNKDFTKFIEQFEFKERTGICSDISVIAPALEIAAVNLSSGYYKPHTLQEYIDLDEVEEIIGKADKLLAADCPESYKYIRREYKYHYGYYGGYGGYQGYRRSYGYGRGGTGSTGGTGNTGPVSGSAYIGYPYDHPTEYDPYDPYDGLYDYYGYKEDWGEKYWEEDRDLYDPLEREHTKARKREQRKKRQQLLAYEEAPLRPIISTSYLDVSDFSSIFVDNEYYYQEAGYDYAQWNPDDALCLTYPLECMLYLNDVTVETAAGKLYYPQTLGISDLGEYYDFSNPKQTDKFTALGKYLETPINADEIV